MGLKEEGEEARIILNIIGNFLGITSKEEKEKRILNNISKLNLLGQTISVNINQTYNLKLPYNATKEAWVIDSNKVHNIKYVISERKGTIIDIYEVEQWHQFKNGRYGFNGICVTNKYPNLIGQEIPKSRGQRNPVTYLQ